MPELNIVRHLVVSLQTRDASDPQTGHVAAGLLIDAESVLVPDPPDRLFELGAEFDVLLFEDGPFVDDGSADRPQAERIAPAAVTRCFPVPSGKSGFAVVQLAVASQHAPSIAADARADGRALLAALAKGGDVWETLEQRHVVTDRHRHGPDAGIFARVGKPRLIPLPDDDVQVNPCKLFSMPWC